MSFEDLPRKPAGVSLGENLDLHSVADLEQRIEMLEAEIGRVKQAIAAKRASKDAADSFFRT